MIRTRKQFDISVNAGKCTVYLPYSDHRLSGKLTFRRANISRSYQDSSLSRWSSFENNVSKILLPQECIQLINRILVYINFASYLRRSLGPSSLPLCIEVDPNRKTTKRTFDQTRLPDLRCNPTHGLPISEVGIAKIHCTHN